MLSLYRDYFPSMPLDFFGQPVWWKSFSGFFRGASLSRSGHVSHSVGLSDSRSVTLYGKLVEKRNIVYPSIPQ